MYVFVFVRESHVAGAFSSLKLHIHVRELWHAFIWESHGMYVFVFIRESHVAGSFVGLKLHIHVRESWHAYEGVKLCKYVFAFIWGRQDKLHMSPWYEYKCMRMITWRDASVYICTGWRRPIGCLKLQVFFCKRATNYSALLRKMTYEDTASYESWPPCTCSACSQIAESMTDTDTLIHIHTHARTHTQIRANRDDVLGCVTWRVMWYNSFICVRHDSFMHVWMQQESRGSPSEQCSLISSVAWHDWFICVITYSFMCECTKRIVGLLPRNIARDTLADILGCVWHDSSICASQLTYVRVNAVTKLGVANRANILRCVTCLVCLCLTTRWCMCGMTHSCICNCSKSNSR